MRGTFRGRRGAFWGLARTSSVDRRTPFGAAPKARKAEFETTSAFIVIDRLFSAFRSAFLGFFLSLRAPESREKPITDAKRDDRRAAARARAGRRRAQRRQI